MSARKNYTTPVNKLVKFFEKSRDNWKAKHEARKVENKRLKNRIRFLESSQKKWKSEALTLRQQLKKTTASAGSLDAKKN